MTLCGFNHSHHIGQGCETYSVESWATLALLSPEAYLDTSLYTESLGAKKSPYHFSASGGQKAAFKNTAHLWSHQHLVEKHLFLISPSDCALKCTQQDSMAWQ